MTETRGKPLPPGVKAIMERAFGHDFSEIRCHPASHLPKALNAKAFAKGNDIHFAPGSFDPRSPVGQELIAHELAHVVQQRNYEHITPTLQGRDQARPAVEKMVKLFKLKS